MDNNSLGMIITVGSLIIGVLVLTGNGDLFMKGGRDDKRKELYDKAKLDRATGIMLLVFGLLSGIDLFTTGMPLKIAYVVSLLVTFTIYVLYIRTRCRK